MTKSQQLVEMSSEKKDGNVVDLSRGFSWTIYYKYQPGGGIIILNSDPNEQPEIIHKDS